MKAWLIEGGTLNHVDVKIPAPKKGEVLLKIKAIGINRADLLQVEGKYPSPDGENIPGLEVSGTIEGEDKLYAALVKSGAYAEYVCVPREHLIELPKNYCYKKAACLPESLITCYLNLFELGDIKNAQAVLIHGGTSGIGTMAIQIAKLLDKKTFVTASTKEKLEAIGNEFNILAHDLFLYSQSWGEQIKDMGGADLILDILGGNSLASNIKCLNKYGKLVMIANMSGSEAQVKTSSILMKNLSIVGSTLRSKSNAEKKNLIANAKDALYEHIVNGDVMPIIDSSFSFSEIPSAHLRMKERKHFGKIVIDLVG